MKTIIKFIKLIDKLISLYPFQYMVMHYMSWVIFIGLDIMEKTDVSTGDKILITLFVSVVATIFLHITMYLLRSIVLGLIYLCNRYPEFRNNVAKIWREL